MPFVYIKTSGKIFLYININNNDSHRRMTTCTFLYIHKAKKNAKQLYIYIKTDILQKARKCALRFYSQKAWHFTLRNFLWKCWNWYLYIFKKHDTLRYVTFLFTKSPTLRKSNTIYVTFYIQKSGHFASRDFYWIFEIA